MKHVLAFYADESGSFDPYDPGQPWVVFLAVGFNDDHWLTIDRAFDALKRAYFPARAAHEVEIRSNDLRTALSRPRAENPFSSLDAGALRRFGDDLYEVVEQLPFAWCGTAIHKATVRQRFAVNDGHALFSLAYRATVERLHRWCLDEDQVGRLFVDQRENNLHGKVHRGIAELHQRFGAWSTHNPRACRVIERPYFHDSRRSHHLQLADIVAYNILRRFREHDPAYSYFARILPKTARAGGAGGLRAGEPGT